MKKLFEKHFEGTWTVIFLICFFFIMIPFPFFYSETYIPSLGGVPSYVYGWLINAAVVFCLICVYFIAYFFIFMVFLFINKTYMKIFS